MVQPILNIRVKREKWSGFLEEYQGSIFKRRGMNLRQVKAIDIHYKMFPHSLICIPRLKTFLKLCIAPSIHLETFRDLISKFGKVVRN
jgi:hypothetical protein